jgi:hypothetical protein
VVTKLTASTIRRDGISSTSRQPSLRASALAAGKHPDEPIDEHADAR